MRHRLLRSLVAVAAALSLVVACSSGAPSTPYANPTSGSLPSFASVRAASAALSNDCAWRFGSTKQGDELAWCDRDSVVVMMLGKGDEMTIAKLTESVSSPDDFCLWWTILKLAYYMTAQIRQNDTASAAASSPTASGQRLAEPTGALFGANWVAFFSSADVGDKLAHNAGGYLLSAPTGCSGDRSTPSMTPTSLTTATTVASFASPASAASAGSQPCLIAVASKGRVFTSLDSVAWREVASLGAPGAVARSESLWVAAGSGKLSISVDGSTWQTKETTADLQAVATDGHAWVGVGYSGAIVTSPDGLNWTSAAADMSWDLSAVGFGGGRWVAVGQTSGTGARGIIVSSDDAKTWTLSYKYDEPRDSGEDLPTFNSLAWNGTQWITVSRHTVKKGDAANWDTVGLNLTSPDGKTWTVTDGLDWFASAVAAHDGTFLAAFGYGGNRTSSDGLHWTVVSQFNLPFGGPPGLIWDGREWLGYGESANVYRSADGIAWEEFALYAGESGYSNLGLVGGIGGACPATP